MGVYWSSFRRKNELQAVLGEFDEDIEGTVEELRSRLAAYANRPDIPEAHAQKLVELEALLGCTPTPDGKSQSRSVSPSSKRTTPSTSQAKASGPAEQKPANISSLAIPTVAWGNSGGSHSKTDVHFRNQDSHGERILQLGFVDRLRKWGVFFDGSTDPLRFADHNVRRHQGTGDHKTNPATIAANEHHFKA